MCPVVSYILTNLLNMAKWVTRYIICVLGLGGSCTKKGVYVVVKYKGVRASLADPE